MALRIGLATPVELWDAGVDRRRELLADIADAGINHMFMADHVSFRDGSGTDGFVEIAALSQLHPSLGVMISIYLLPLRHPVPVARQLATMGKIAAGRVTLGVGIGGEDRHEVEVCGVDPSSRGRRMDECLQIVRPLMRGETISFSGEFFQLDQVRIKPAPQPAIPIIVGGRSNAALVRTGRYGDGWIGAWCSVRRFQEATGIIDQAAADAGRGPVPWQHGYQPWVGIADNRTEARKRVAAGMEAFYKVPFEQFERYVPFGTPAEVADMLAPYVAAGCSIMNLKVVAGDDAEALQGAADIARDLRAAAG